MVIYYIVAAQCGKKILAPRAFIGSCDTRLFVAWVDASTRTEICADGGNG